MSRKNWDEYFLRICKQVGSNTKCLSRQIGAILVKDKSIIATGYNGPPRGVPTCSERCYKDPALVKILGEINIDGIDASKLKKCPRQILGYKSGQGLEWCVAGHAERNCLINAARTGVCTKGTTLYMDCGIPCTPCMVEIINAGVDEIVVTKISFYDISAEYLLKSSGIKYRIFCEEIAMDN